MVNMKIDHFVVGPVQTNCYFVTNIKTKEMIIIDILLSSDISSTILPYSMLILPKSNTCL